NLFVVFHRLGRGRRRALSRAGVRTAATAAAFVALAIEHLHVLRDDLGAVALLPRFLVVPTVGAQRAFDVDELSLLQILPANFGELRPRDDVVPLLRPRFSPLRSG